MNNDDFYCLDVWKGDWGLPSVDVDCLLILAYAKFNGVPLKIRTTNNPFRTPNGRLPVLRHGSNVLGSVNEILKYFRSQNYNSDFTLSARECAEVTAYITLLKDKLYPALQFIWWLDQRNLNELVRPWYCKALPFPFNLYYPGYYERRAKTLMESLYPTEDNISAIENAVYSEAQKCITLLSTRLGKSDYFGGLHTSTMDAVVYAYLAPILKTPLPNPALQNHLRACENLVKFISRITQNHFENDYREYEKVKAGNEQRMRSNSESEFPNRRRNQIVAGFVAALAMLGYAFSTGIFEVLSSNDELSNASYDDEEVDD